MRFSDDSPDLARLADTNTPAFLFDERGALIWANAAAAVYWGAPRRSALLSTDFTRHSIAEQARMLVRTLPEGASRLERLRLVPFGRTTPLVAEVKRLAGAVLVTGLERVAAARVAAVHAAEAAAAAPAAAKAGANPLPKSEAAAPVVAAPPEPEPALAGPEPAASDEQPIPSPTSEAESEPATAQAGPPELAEVAAEPIAGSAHGAEAAGNVLSVVSVLAEAEAAIPSAADVPAETAQTTSSEEDSAPAPTKANEPVALPAEANWPADDEAAGPGEALAAEAPATREAPRTQAPAPSPLVTALASRERPLRFAWQTDPAGRLTSVSPDFVAAVGAEAMPGPEEALAAFAARAALDEGALAERLAAAGSFAGVTVTWPIAGASERALVELAAAPAGPQGGKRGFGVLRGLVPEPAASPNEQAPAPDEPEAAEAVPEASEAEAEAEPIASPQEDESAEPAREVAEVPAEEAAAEEPSAAPDESAPREISEEPEPAIASVETPEQPSQCSEKAARVEEALESLEAPAEPPALAAALELAEIPPPEAPANVLRFPGAPPLTGERRLAPSDEAALRTIARVLGGPIAVANAEAPRPAPLPEAAEQPVRPPEAPARPAPLPEAPPPAVPSALFAAPSLETAEVAELRRALAAARERESELRGILDTASDGVVLLDSAGRIESLNRSAEALFGVESGEIAGEPFQRLLAPESHRAAADYLDGLASHGVASVLNDGREVVGIERNGGAIPLFMTMGRLASGVAGDRYCAVLRDITQWKTAERELTEAKRQAERASHQKSDFLAKVSHEIRTPLNAIIGFSEVMLEERFGRMENERYRGYLADIRASGEHLLSLVNDLLDLSKIESGRIDLIFGQVKLADIAQQAVATMQPQANREGVILRTSLPPVPPVVADARSIRQILFNLLSNAVKFTRSGGQVIVSLAATDTGEIALRVRDTGIGMSPGEIAMALEPFRQVATRSRFEADGTGLGLPLTKALAEANRAAFSIDSHPGEGTLVQILFPPTRVLAE